MGQADRASTDKQGAQLRKWQNGLYVMHMAHLKAASYYSGQIGYDCRDRYQRLTGRRGKLRHLESKSMPDTAYPSKPAGLSGPSATASAANPPDKSAQPGQGGYQRLDF